MATPPPPLSAEMERVLMDKRWKVAGDLIHELSREIGLEHTFQTQVDVDDIVKAILYTGDREPLLKRLPTRDRYILGGFISTAIWHARDSDPSVRERILAFIPDEEVTKALAPFGEILSVRPLPFPTENPLFKHLSSLRREVVLKKKESTDMPAIIPIVYMQRTFKIFVGEDTTCSGCPSRESVTKNITANDETLNRKRSLPEMSTCNTVEECTHQGKRPRPSPPTIESPLPKINPMNIEAPEGPVCPRPTMSKHPEPTPPARPDFVAQRGPLLTQETLGPAAPTPDVEMSIVEETSASSTSSTRNSTEYDLVAFIKRNPGVSFAGTDGLGREEVLDLLSSRTKAQRHAPMLTPPQSDALAGLISQLLDLRPGGCSNIYKILRQVKAKLRTTPAAVILTPPLPAPRPVEPTPPAPHGEETTPAMATPPLPPSAHVEDGPVPDRWTVLLNRVRESTRGPFSGIVFQATFFPSEIVEVIRYPEERKSFLAEHPPDMKNLLAQFLDTVIEHTRHLDPFIREGLSELRAALPS
ncbi:hypothetical protein LAZ67_4001659 [Cordylochernes scorpioides]|uniref:Gag protein n=1 Tax=Cordylochernes scorpioides TaxID=51811 RepID=A0ABY6KC61_9ARAC|nr:hypothetical protein LAZ67_4001659 [Cordylochernes scorpioides]